MNGHASPSRPPPSSPPHGTAAASSSSATSSPSSAAAAPLPGVSGEELDALLATLDAKHSAQVREFQLAEQRWQAKLAAMEERQRELQRQIDNRGAAGESDEAALLLQLAVAPDSLLHRAINFAKVAVPIGVAAYAAFTLAKEIQRRMKARV